jgi:hypothetical protein
VHPSLSNIEEVQYPKDVLCFIIVLDLVSLTQDVKSGV